MPALTPERGRTNWRVQGPLLAFMLVSLGLAFVVFRFFLGCEGKPTRVDFTLNDVDGNRVSFSSLRGKAVVLSFWFLG